jgi:hypothetical protein
MKRFSLLWLNGRGGNEEFLCTLAANAEDAARNLGMPASGYIKYANGGAWCVAEKFQSIC